MFTFSKKKKLIIICIEILKVSEFFYLFRYTECTKFLSRVCEIVSSREEAIEVVEKFSLVLRPLFLKLDNIEEVLVHHNQASASDDLKKIRDELEVIEELIKSLKKFVS